MSNSITLYFMVLQTINHLPDGTHLYYPIVICSDPADCVVTSISRTGKVYQRRKRLHFTQGEYEWRCSTLVSPSSHGSHYDPVCDGIPFIYFSVGKEGDPITMLGLPSTELEKQRARESHFSAHDFNKDKMRQYDRANKEKLTAYIKDYMEKHPEYTKKRYQAHKEYFRNYYKTHKRNK